MPRPLVLVSAIPPNMAPPPGSARGHRPHLILGGSLFALVTRHSDALLAAQLTADHVKCWGLFRPAAGASMSAPQAQQMLAER